MGIRDGLRRLIEVRPSPRRWPIATGAAIALAVPALAFTLAGEPALGLVASNGAFLTLHLGDRPAAQRARRLPFVAAGLFAGAALAALAAPVPVLGTLVLAGIALAAAVLTLGYRAGPPGSVFFVMVPGIIGSLVAPRSLGGAGDDPLVVLGVLAVGLAFAYLVVLAPLALPAVRARSRDAGPPAPLRFALTDESRIVLARVAVAIVLATAVSIPLGLHRSYWVLVTVVAVLQSGVLRRLTALRATHRILGTVLGAGIFLVLALAGPDGVLLVLALAALQYVVELLVVRHYGLALVFITPLALLVAARAPGTDAPGLAAERIVDTGMGAAIAVLVLAVEFALERRAARTGADGHAPLS
ncbi:FUSC family protein [Naasia sp. SYSU D00057]|uniref:FUSC family protein n=1 Tax=Naasia sp. SYSU D00057 TaxID=2817380 RepID=UPI001B30FD95|nr:FUSC family protein [Naasia sp. SYSU D00057]